MPRIYCSVFWVCGCFGSSQGGIDYLPDQGSDITHRRHHSRMFYFTVLVHRVQQNICAHLLSFVASSRGLDYVPLWNLNFYFGRRQWRDCSFHQIMQLYSSHISNVLFEARKINHLNCSCAVKECMYITYNNVLFYYANLWSTENWECNFWQFL